MNNSQPIDQLQDLERQNVTLPEAANPTVELPSFDEARSQFIRSYLSHTLQMTGGNVSQAAKLAKRNRTDFYKLLQRYLLVPSDFKIYPS